MSYQPIATKALPGTDSVTGLARQIQVWKLTCDAKSETVSVAYDVVTVLDSGKVASILLTDQYRRYNADLNSKFDALRASQAGQDITALITSDLNLITSFETIRSDLMQAVILPQQNNP